MTWLDRGKLCAPKVTCIKRNKTRLHLSFRSTFLLSSSSLPHIYWPSGFYLSPSLEMKNPHRRGGFPLQIWIPWWILGGTALSHGAAIVSGGSSQSSTRLVLMLPWAAYPPSHSIRQLLRSLSAWPCCFSMKRVANTTRLPSDKNRCTGMKYVLCGLFILGL